MNNLLPVEMLDSAAGTFLILSNLARQLDLVAGRPTPNADGAMVVAAMIAQGEAPAMAAEAAEAAADVAVPLGDNADVPVSPEEDDCCGRRTSAAVCRATVAPRTTTPGTHHEGAAQATSTGWSRSGSRSACLAWDSPSTSSSPVFAG